MLELRVMRSSSGMATNFNYRSSARLRPLRWLKHLDLHPHPYRTATFTAGLVELPAPITKSCNPLGALAGARKFTW